MVRYGMAAVEVYGIRLDQSFTRRCALRFYRLFMVLGLTEGPATWVCRSNH